MRLEVIQCEICEAIHRYATSTTQYVLPESWLTVKEGDSSAELHFCRDECLAIWLQRRGNAITPKLEKPQEQPACKARRFLLVDESANITEGVKWGNGFVVLDHEQLVGASRYLFRNWEELKESNPGSGVQWIDQEVAE